MTEEEFKFNAIKTSIDQYIGVTTGEIRKKKTEEDTARANFVKLINDYEKLIDRDTQAMIELSVIEISFSAYNAPFYEMIEYMVEMLFPNETVRNLIYFYLYDRFNDFGEIMPIAIGEDQYLIQSPLQLYGIIEYVLEQEGA